MSTDEIKRRVTSLVEDVIREDPDEESAAFASLLLGILSVQRDERLVEAAHALWEFIDAEGQAGRPTAFSGPCL
jgi:hypothetical protein